MATGPTAAAEAHDQDSPRADSPRPEPKIPTNGQSVADLFKIQGWENKHTTQWSASAAARREKKIDTRADSARSRKSGDGGNAEIVVLKFQKSQYRQISCFNVPMPASTRPTSQIENSK